MNGSFQTHSWNCDHDYNLYKNFAEWQLANVSIKCANADTKGTLYLQMQVALRMEVNMHDACTGLVQASFMHCQLLKHTGTT